MFDFDPERLQFLMNKEGLSQDALAAKLAALCEAQKPSKQTVSSWLRGHEPRFSFVTRLAFIFKVEPGYFAGRKKGRGAA